MNLICTPRTSWYSETSSQEIRESAANEVRRGLAGKMPASLRYCVNRDYLNVPRKFFFSFFLVVFLHLLDFSSFEKALNGASAFPSIFPLAAPFLPPSAASQFLTDTSSTGNSTAPSLLSAAGSSSPVVVPVTIGESALQAAAKVAAASHGISTSNNNNNGSESTSGD